MRILFSFIALSLSISNYACDCFDYEDNFFKNASSSYQINNLVLVDTVYTDGEYNSKYTRAILLEKWDDSDFEIGDTLLIEGQNGANCGDNMNFEKGDTLVISTGTSINYLMGDCGINYLLIENGQNAGRSIAEIKAKIESGDDRIHKDFWKPFIENTHSVYQYIENGDTFYQHLNIEALEEGFYTDDTLWFSNMQMDCRTSTMATMQVSAYYHPSPYMISFDENDLMTYKDPFNNHQFKFDAFADSTSFSARNEVFIFLDTITIENILDTIDSVKHFIFSYEDAEPHHMSLSKHYGFTKWHNFSAYTRADEEEAYRDLILIEQIDKKDSNQIKHFPLEFEDYFHLNAGDTRLWKDESLDWELLIDEFEYILDSITLAIHSEDSAYYEFTRTEYDSLGNFDTSYTGKEVYYKNEYEPILRASSKQTLIGLPIAYDSSAILFKTNYKKDQGQIGFHLWTTDKSIYGCSIGTIADLSENFTFDTDFGLSAIGYASWGVYGKKIIGGIINGIEYGIISIPTSIEELTKNPINIFPNPSTGIFSLVLENSSIHEITVFDLKGSVIYQEAVQGHYASFELDKEGLYILQIKDNQSIRRKKLIVNH